MRILAVCSALLLVACAESLTGPLAESSWGGTGISLQVTATAAHMEFDCGSGDVASAVNVVDNRFSAQGTVIVGHGGPTREGEPPDVRPATFSGTIDGDAMSLDVSVGGSAPFVNHFKLVRNAQPLLHLCL